MTNVLNSVATGDARLDLVVLTRDDGSPAGQAMPVTLTAKTKPA